MTDDSDEDMGLTWSENADRSPLAVQKATFTNWVNHQLKGTGKKVCNIDRGFEDGIVLIKLLKSLTQGAKMPSK